MSDSFHTCLHEGMAYLKDKGVREAETDAWMLMEYAANIDRTFYSLHMRDTMDDADEAAYRELLRKRGERIPVQYLIGEAWFYGNCFKVTPDVLIPRQDTEVLVEQAERQCFPGMRILDVCTGSGCILLSLLKEHSVTGVGTDLSADALAVARENQRLLGIKDSQVNWVQGDLFENIGGVFDLIVSNPPYIPSGDLAGLDPEVRDHEPKMALDGHADGLYFERQIAERARIYLREEGWLFLEIGYDEGASMKRILEDLGYQEVSIVQDLAHKDRVAVGRMV